MIGFRPLHAHGLVQNHSPKPARMRREMARLAANIRKVLWRTPGRLVLWVERDWRQAKASGRHYFSTAKLTAPYSGRVIAMGPRAILMLTGKPPVELPIPTSVVGTVGSRKGEEFGNATYQPLTTRRDTPPRSTNADQVPPQHPVPPVPLRGTMLLHDEHHREEYAHGGGR